MARAGETWEKAGHCASSAVVAFKGGPIPGEPVDNLVNFLREALGAAEQGHIQGMAFVVLNLDKSLFMGWEVGPDCRELTGGIALLQHRYLTRLTDE